VYNKSTEKYEYDFDAIDVYDYSAKEFVMFFIFPRNATLKEQKLSFKKLHSDTKIFLFEKYSVKSESELFDSYKKFVEEFYDNYDSIKVPKNYGYTNLILEALPRSGKLIRFKLNHGN